MKIDFRKIELKDVEGNSFEMDVSRELGNSIYRDTTDIGELELAREIYLKGEVEVDSAKAAVLRRYVERGYKAFVKEAVIPVLDRIINVQE